VVGGDGGGAGGGAVSPASPPPRPPPRPCLRGPPPPPDGARPLPAPGPRRDPADGHRAVALDSRVGPRTDSSRGGVADGQYPHRGSACGGPADHAAGRLVKEDGAMRMWSIGVGGAGWFAGGRGGARARERHSGGGAGGGGAAQIARGEGGRGGGRETKPARRTFEVTSSTRIARVQRAAMGDDGWPGGWASEPTKLSNVHVGDFVTVSVEPHGRRN